MAAVPTDPFPTVELAIALGLGMLVGLERELAAGRGEAPAAKIAGIRTFPLITALGLLCGWLGGSSIGLLLAAGLLTLTALAVMGNRLHLERATREGQLLDPGLTTELAVLVMFLVGAVLATGHRAVAVALGGAVSVLLHARGSLHQLVARIGEEEARSIFRFTLLALVILPLLPDRTYGPYDVLNPFRIWWIVVLIVGVSLAAYVAARLLGVWGGVLLGGALGGLISSTATTVSESGRVREGTSPVLASLLVIQLASTVVFVRVLFEIGVVSPRLLPALVPPLSTMLGVMVALSALVYAVFRQRPAEQRPPEPSQGLRAAIVFGLLYAVVLLAVAAAKEHFGEGALYLVAALSGLTDLDAITLSTAQLVQEDRIPVDTGWRLILVGALSNLVSKAGVVAVLGTRRLLAGVAAVFGAALLGGGLLLVLWP
jgi:uncharacterized membrane protein (DUF4010 family)